MKHFRLTPQPAPRLDENAVERQCLDALGYRQYRAERLHSGKFRSMDTKRVIAGHPKGTPDYVVTHGLYPAFYLEVKRPGETPSPVQELKHVELHLNNLAVVWVDSYEMLLTWLAQHQQQTREKWREELGNEC